MRYFHLTRIALAIDDSEEMLPIMGGFEPFEVMQAPEGMPLLSVTLSSAPCLPVAGEGYFSQTTSFTHIVYHADTSHRTVMDIYDPEGHLVGQARYDEEAGSAVLRSPDPSVLRLALWECFGFFALPHDVLPIHSAVVKSGGRGALFLGSSGTGKSTHARLWIAHIPTTTLLNDDSPIIYFDEENRLMVSGSPWGGKTPLFLNEQYPVLGLVRLHQAPENQMARLDTLQAIGALMPSFSSAIRLHPRFCRHLYRFVGHIVAIGRIYFLACLPDKDAAELCHDTMEKGSPT